MILLKVYEHTCMVSDLRAGAQTVVESAWKLLENLVNRLEPSTQSNSVLHRAVASKLISLGAFLPSWLVTGYKVSKHYYFLKRSLKVNASMGPILVTIFLRVILRFIFHLETILKTISSENSCQIENSPQNSLQTENEP